MQKIMFNDRYGLTDAVLQGRKTMTRRLCKDSATGEVILAKDVESVRFYPDNIAEFVMTNGDVRCSVPQYQIGEVVAIAQSYRDAGYTKEWVVRNIKPNPNAKPTDPFEEKYPGWNNKMFVKAEFMPNFIRFNDLKIEMLQDISEEDCLKEGVFQWGDPFHEDRVEDFGFVGATRHYDTPREAFSALIDKVSGRGTWDRNPWVFAYSFEILKEGGEQ